MYKLKIHLSPKVTVSYSGDCLQTILDKADQHFGHVQTKLVLEKYENGERVSRVTLFDKEAA